MSNNSIIQVPAILNTYVETENHFNLKRIIESNKFFPVMIVGPSGTGKSITVEQVCAQLNREYCRIQITPETDEDSLIGGFRIRNGDMEFDDGPVLRAMRSGAILMIDEIDRGSNKIMCLQAVMEGKPLTIKRTGEIVYPAPGFNIVVTGNTKGRGDQSGRYMAACIIDDAFLERIPVTLIHDYPSEQDESEILRRHMESLNLKDEVVFRALLKWSRKSRPTILDDEEDEAVISTRRMCMVADMISMVGDDAQAVQLVCNRYETSDTAALVTSYAAIRPDVQREVEEAARMKEIAERSNKFVDTDTGDAVDSLIERMKARKAARGG